MGAFDLENIGGAQDTAGYGDENTDDNTFNVRDRDNGLNLDFMTYSMYKLADQNPQALLDAAILEDLAQTTFSTFLQHYVSSNVSFDSGSWAYQPINASLPSDLTKIYNETSGETPEYQDVLHPISHTNRTATVEIKTPLLLLRMNSVSVWLSVSIIIWLAGSAIVIAIMQRMYLKLLLRDVECIGDVLALVCGSEKLLQLVRDQNIEELHRDRYGVMTKLGSFEGSNGETRWGVEVVDAR